MRLKNKKTGEIMEVITGDTFGVGGVQLRSIRRDPQIVRYYNSLAALNEEWEDAPEEPKGSALDLMILTLINFIENEPDEDKVNLEDCKQMLEKLEAWKRLKDKGFRFRGLCESVHELPAIEYDIDVDVSRDSQEEDDLDICFGGEE